VGDHSDLLPRVLLGQGVDRGDHPLLHGQQGLAPTGRHPIGHPGAPKLGLVGHLLFNLGKAAAFKITKSTLSQADMGGQARTGVQGQGLCRGQCTLQVTAVNSVHRVGLGQGLPQQLCLALTVIIEGNVGMPLDAGAGVPGGFAMSNGYDAG